MLVLMLILLFLILAFPFLIEPNSIREFYRKKPKYDIQDEMSFLNEAKWVGKVINSCEYIRQVWTCDRLIRALDNKYRNKVDSNLKRKVIYDLNTSWLNQEDKLLRYASKNK